VIWNLLRTANIEIHSAFYFAEKLTQLLLCVIIQATTAQSFNVQACFAIDYDFATHRCYFFGTNVLLDNLNMPVFLHCIIIPGVPQPSSLGLRPNPTVVHITLCEFSRPSFRGTIKCVGRVVQPFIGMESSGAFRLLA